MLFASLGYLEFRSILLAILPILKLDCLHFLCIPKNLLPQFERLLKERIAAETLCASLEYLRFRNILPAILPILELDCLHLLCIFVLICRTPLF